MADVSQLVPVIIHSFILILCGSATSADNNFHNRLCCCACEGCLEPREGAPCH